MNTERHNTHDEGESRRHSEYLAYLRADEMNTQLLRAKVTRSEHLTTDQKVKTIHLAGAFIEKVGRAMRELNLDERGCHRATGEPATDSEHNLVSLMLEAEREIGATPSDEEIDRMNPADAVRALAERERMRNVAYIAMLKLTSQ